MTPPTTVEFPTIQVSGFGDNFQAGAGISHAGKSPLVFQRAVPLMRAWGNSIVANRSVSQAGVTSSQITFSSNTAVTNDAILHALEWFKRGAPAEKITGIQGPESFKTLVSAAAAQLGIQVTPTNGLAPTRPAIAARPTTPAPQPVVTA